MTLIHLARLQRAPLRERTLKTLASFSLTLRNCELDLRNAPQSLTLSHVKNGASFFASKLRENRRFAGLIRREWWHATELRSETGQINQKVMQSSLLVHEF